jgi:CysZ protein
MPTSLLRGFAALSDPTVRRVLWIGIAGALAAFLCLTAGAWYLLLHIDLLSAAWLDRALDLFGGLLVVAIAWLLFPAIVVGISGLLLDEVAAAVERRSYPGLPPPRELGLARSVWLSLRFFAVVVVLNLLALPVYLFVPALNLLVFYLLNGYLLGREYFELVALRRMEMAEAKVMRRTYGVRLFWAGIVIAFLSTIPLVNLLVPVVATAFMAHVFYGEIGYARHPAGLLRFE